MISKLSNIKSPTITATLMMSLPFECCLISFVKLSFLETPIEKLRKDTKKYVY